MGKHRGLLTIVLLWFVAPASAWETVLTGPAAVAGSAKAVAVAPDGDVLAVGYTGVTQQTADFTVARLAGEGGAERWRLVLPGPVTPGAGNEEATDVAVAANGDVIAVGRTSAPGVEAQFTVVKLAGDTGAVVWRRDAVARNHGSRVAVVLDPNGDAYVMDAAIDPLIEDWVPRITRHASATGNVIWSHLGVPGNGADIALHPSGDIIVLASSFPAPFVAGGLVTRLNRANGAEMWSTGLLDVKPSGRLAVGPDGSVFAGAADQVPPFGPHGSASLVDGETGDVRWSRTLDNAVDDAVVLPSGDVAVLETTFVFSPRLGPQAHTLHVELLAAVDGTTQAAHEFPRDSSGSPLFCPCGARGRGVALVRDPVSGDLFVVGGYRQQTLLVARLDGNDLHEVWLVESREVPAIPGLVTPSAAVRAPNGTLVVGGGSIRRLSEGTHRFVVTTFSPDGATLACGDGVIDPGEACDGGILEDGPCCSGDCRTKQPDGAACDDGSRCTLGDRCSEGLCAGTSRLPCEPCGVCEPTIGCSGRPNYECQNATTTNASALTVVRPQSGKHRFQWTMRSGPATSVGDLGDPSGATGYALCGFDGEGRVLVRAVAPAGSCGRRSCWKRTKRGFSFSDPHAGDGLQRLTLRSGDAGRSRFAAVGAKANALVPVLPAPASLRLELRRLDAPGICWAADIGTVTRNTQRRYRATGN